MFKRDSILHDVNIISKTISAVIALLGLIFLHSSALIVLISVVLFFLAHEFKILSKISVIGILFAVLATFFPQWLWIPKCLTFIIYLSLVKKITASQELRYALEVTLYKFQSKKITYHILYIIYFFRYLKKNMVLLDNLREDYGMDKDWFYIRFSLKKAYSKTKYELRDLMEINKLRFYNYSSSRTYIEKPTWEKWDTQYLLAHLVSFLFILIYGG